MPYIEFERGFILRQSVIHYFIKMVWLTAITIILMLVGCHRAAKIDFDDKDVDRLPTRVASAQDPGAKRLLKQLTKQGVRVVSMGQNYLVSIPAILLFTDESPRIRWESYALLNTVVCYLKQFRKIDVDIAGFSSPYVSPARERALTSARARAVADYLWSQDIDSRFIFTRGLGSDKPIVFKRGGGDVSPNSRIEITFRDAVA
jgi:intracellular multiplication protein IcmN